MMGYKYVGLLPAIGLAATGLILACGSNGADGSSDSGSDPGSSSGGAVGTGGTGTGESATGGVGPSGGVGSCSIFPADNAFNRDISGLPVHEDSDAIIDRIGRDDNVHPDFGTEWEGAPIGIPYVMVGTGQSMVAVDYQAYDDESDPGPFPIPIDAPIEGGPDSDGDRHVIAVDLDACRLYELYRAFPVGDHWEADSGAVFDLTQNDTHPPGCTSADAAGLPIFPGLARYDEIVTEGAIHHALRFTVSESRRAYVAPASHYASDATDEDLPPMGMRFRMKASYECSGYSAEAQVVCTALKTYGLILADNGSNWYISGAPDPRFQDDALGDLKQITGDAFEVVETGDPVITEAPDCTIP